jgi:hypothetical protein
MMVTLKRGKHRSEDIASEPHIARGDDANDRINLAKIRNMFLVSKKRLQDQTSHHRYFLVKDDSTQAHVEFVKTRVINLPVGQNCSENCNPHGLDSFR